MARRTDSVLSPLILLALLCCPLGAQMPVTYDRLLNAAKEPRNWLLYGGDYFSNRYSALSQIRPQT
jgi:glucose dehydrogenase